MQRCPVERSFEASLQANKSGSKSGGASIKFSTRDDSFTITGIIPDLNGIVYCSYSCSINFRRGFAEQQNLIGDVLCNSFENPFE